MPLLFVSTSILPLGSLTPEPQVSFPPKPVDVFVSPWDALILPKIYHGHKCFRNFGNVRSLV